MTDTAKVRPSAEEMLREDIDRVVAVLLVPVSLFLASREGELARCTPDARNAMVVRFAVTWLLTNGLVVTAPDGAFEAVLDAELPAAVAGDVDAKLLEFVVRGELQSAAERRT